MCEEAQRVLQAREQEEVEEVDEAQAAQVAEPWGAAGQGREGSTAQPQPVERHPQEAPLLTVSRGRVLAVGHSGEAQQGHGTEQVGGSAEAQGEGGGLEGAELERLLAVWGHPWAEQPGRGVTSSLASTAPARPLRQGLGSTGTPGGTVSPRASGHQERTVRPPRHPGPAPCRPREPNPEGRDLSVVSGFLRTRFSGGSVSGRKQKRNSRSETAKSRASQGAIRSGRQAPSMGPSVKPSEKATPMTAWGEATVRREARPRSPSWPPPSTGTHHASAAGGRRAQVGNDGRGEADVPLADAANHPGGQEGREALRGGPHGVRGGQTCLPRGRSQGQAPSPQARRGCLGPQHPWSLPCSAAPKGPCVPSVRGWQKRLWDSLA